MTTIRRIVTSQVDGNDANTNNDSEIRPFGETAIYLDTNGPVDKPVLAMHDGVRTHIRSKVLGPGVLYGSNADAGDGSNADTIKLIPDALLYDQGSNQYIVVDPTGGEPGHIHLRAGGTQDASSADLYLGGELTCVRISDTSKIVTVRTTNIGDPNITLDWSFQPDGNLYFPGIGNNRIGESEPGLVVSSDNSVVLQSNNNGESKEWLFNTNGSITFPDSTIQTTAYTGGADTLDSVTDRGATTTNNITVGAVITTDVTGKTAPAVGTRVTGIRPPEGAGSNNGYVWVPDETQISSLGDITGWTLTNSNGIFSTTVVQMRNDLGAAWAIETADPLIYTGTYTFTSPDYAAPAPLPLDINVSNKTWTFDTNGDLSLPNGITVMGGAPSLIVDTGNNLGIGTSRLQSASANCAIAVGDEFVADIEFNDDITVVQVGWTVVVGGTTYTVTAIDPAPPANQYRITAAGATFVQSTTYTFTNPTPIPSAWVFGNDGSLTTPGSGVISHLDNDLKVEVSGTDVIVLRTDGGDTVINADGSMTLPGGSSITDTGVMILGSGDTIGEGQRAARIGINGSVEGVAIGAGPHDWLFTNDGTLTFPGGMTIDTEYGGTTRLVIDGKSNGVDIRSDGNILIGYNSSGNVYIGNPSGGDQVDILGSRFRVLVDVPAHSTGSAGDQVGQLAVDNSYIYYCFANFGTAPTETFTVVNVGEFTNTISVNMAANPNYTVPQAGWYVVIGGVTMTLTAFSGASGSNYNFIFDNPSGVALPSTVTLTSNTGYTNIWKRVAWSADTW